VSGLSVNKVQQVLAEGARSLWERPRMQVPALDALRSFAILLVIGSHWAIKEYVNAGGVRTPVQDWPIFSYGWTGVDLFFVLSGFLIGKQLWRELETTGTVQLGRFLLRRGLRIWPVYFAMLAFYAFTSDIVQPRFSDWVFLSNYLPSGFGRGWTLSTEEQFYIAVPLLILALRSTVTLRRFAWVLLGVQVLVLVGRYFTLEALDAGRIPANQSDRWLVTPFHTHMEGLLAGLLIALFAVIKPEHFRRDASRGFARDGFAVFVGATALAVGLRVLGGKLFSFVALGLIFGGLTYWVLLDRSPLTRWLGWHGWYPVSRLSYGMYLNHWWALPFTNHWIVAGLQRVTDEPVIVYVGGLVLGTLVSIAVAAVTFVLIEHPFLVIRDEYLSATRRPVRHGAAPASADPA
jgi:peptidoglycan/LPS O-acetylase OafA/YrhL